MTYMILLEEECEIYDLICFVNNDFDNRNSLVWNYLPYYSLFCKPPSLQITVFRVV